MTSVSPLKIWLADLTYTQQTIAADVIPNAVGCIALYTEQCVQLAHPIRIFKYPEKLAAALNSGERPDLIGFSNYVWNGTLSYGFAEAIKRHLPETIVVFGGPNYPTASAEQVRYLRERPAVDFYIIKEGEVAFANLVQALTESEGDVEQVKSIQIPSVHCLTADGNPLLAGPARRLDDLTDIPSPYTSGRLDEFFDGRLLPIIQTNRGCPFTCTFCVEGVKYYCKVSRNSLEKIQAELDYIGRKMEELRAEGGRNDLFIADSNFGMYQEDLDTARALAETRRLYGWPEYINVATGKNQKERVLEASRIIDGALRLSGSVQSLDPAVLENIKRKNINAEELFALGLQAAEVGANTYSEIILALPGDSLKAHMETVKTVMNAGFTNIFLFQLMLLPGTDMATDESKQKFGMVTRFRVLPRCYGYYDVLGERIHAVEIEEICVANSTLSFQEYLLARRFHLVVTIFHNDGVFAALLKLLRGLNVSVFRWMEIMAEAPLSDSLQLLFDSFLTETVNELWDNRENLDRFVRQPGVIDKFIAGELGNNLLFVHKSAGITSCLDQLAAFASDTIKQCLQEFGCDHQEVLTFVDDALQYHCACARNLFQDQDITPVIPLRYDVAGFLGGPRDAVIDDYRLASPTPYHFILDESQHTLIKRYLGIYGDSAVAIGRILSKVHVKKLFRHAISGTKVESGEISPSSSEAVAFHRFGLQQ
jgi:radical SAM superfamily enzyme YgiQ (UPF0313 family)